MTTMTKILFAVSILALATAEPSRQTRQISTNTNRTLNKAVEAITKLKSELKKVKNQINSGKGVLTSYFTLSHTLSCLYH